MPGRISGHKRNYDEQLRGEDDDDDEGRAASPFSDGEFGTPAKRRRREIEGDGNEDYNEDYNDACNGTGTYNSQERPLLPSNYRADHRPTNGASTQQSYQPGSIVRVALSNFVTYKKAEFHLGPSLNMIIGPNGTGKSTVVCAICLGLGWKTEHLGRAKDISEFVRHGAIDAEVEIELARDPARQLTNQIVKLVIKKSTNKSAFFLNGRAVARKEVTNMCKAFSIQVDNLCQFLPQDRVVEFAALSPVDLLGQTLRAAAPQTMTDMHEQLKELHAESKKATEDRKALGTSLQQHENRQNMQRSDVERLQQRALLVEEIRALNLLLPQREYAAARTVWQAAVDRKKAAQHALEDLKKEVQPSLRAVAEKQEYAESIQAVVERTRKLVSRSEQNATALSAKQEKYLSDVEVSNRAIASQRGRERGLKLQRAQVKAQINDIQASMKEAPPEVDSAAYNEKARDITRQIRELSDAAQAANARQTTCVNEIKQRKNQIAAHRADLETLHTQAGQQEAKLRRVSAQTQEAWSWVQNNSHLFKDTVYGPPLLTCSVKDKRHAIYLENVLSRSELIAITVTNKEDFRRLEDQTLGAMKLVDVAIRTSIMPVSHWQAHVPKAQLAEYGLDIYMIDLVEGPEVVLSMLCEQRRLHDAAVAFQGLTDAQNEALSKSTISSYITPNDSVTITRRREYGEQGVSSRTRRLNPPQFFNDAQADMSAERSINEKIKDLEREVLTYSEEAVSHRDSTKKSGDRVRTLQAEKSQILEEKDQKQKAVTLFNALPAKLSAAEGKVANCNTQLMTTAANIKAEQAKIDEANLARGKDALMFAANVQALQKSHVDLFEAELLLIEAGSDVENLKQRNTDVQKLLDEREAEINELRTQSRAVQQTVKRLLEKVQEIEATLTDRDREIQGEQAEDQSVDDLKGEIDSRQARLDMVHGGDSNIMAEFEERARKIERLKSKLAQVDAELGGYDGKITDIRSRWEPQLDALIQQISEAFGENFQRIGCAGQVEVCKEEDFAEWSIQVMVKFREHEQLSVLDAHRQSGGERAVSTIFYLMALQSLARAPFRVVDEINQGMDPRNERLVHSRMVDIACAENTSQYFLITPKLLPGLDYHPKMKIHCIASGEYMPEDHKQLDFERLAQHALAVTRRLSGRV